MSTSGSTSLNLRSLIERARRGDLGARDSLLARYRPYLRLVAEQSMRAVFRSKFDGSDVAQQTCIEACEAIGRFRGETEAEFAAWLNRILHNNISNLARDHTAQKRDVRREIPLVADACDVSLQWHDVAHSQTGPPSHTLRGEAALTVAESLWKLPVSQRMAVQMRFLEGCKLNEIAEQMDKSPSAVAGLIYRGLAALRRALPQELAEL